MRRLLTGLCAFVCADVALAQCDAWVNPVPSHRRDHAMAHDAARNVTVLFGGWTNSTYDGSTWEWNGEDWIVRQVTGPSARRGAAMAFDHARGVTVLFGGRNADGNLGDTWEWDGQTWTQIAASGPAARVDHAMVYDAERSQVVLFGGFGLADTWTWDGTTWTQVATTGPSARTDPGLAFDSVRQVVVLHGGWAPGPSTETWEWDGVAWTLRATDGPGRQGHAMAFDSVRSQTIIHAGFDESFSYSNDTWAWNGTTWTQLDDGTNGPPNRSTTRMVFDAAQEQMVLFGGTLLSSGESDDVWTWDGGTWDLAHVSPPQRTSPEMEFDPNLGEVLMFGGYAPQSPGNMPYDDTWSWNGRRWAPRASGEGQSPAGSQSATMAFDSFRSRMLMFDHIAGETRTWAYTPDTWTLLSDAGPDVLYHEMVYDTVRDRLVLFGGYDFNNPTSETWEWDGSFWTQVATTGPSPRFGFGMAYDPIRQRTVLFGGSNGGPGMDDTWEWNGSSWIQVATGGITARAYHGMTYDADRAMTVVFGGSASGYDDELWGWNGLAWTLIVDGGGPAGRWTHGMAHDAGRHQLVVFAGDGDLPPAHPPFGDIWEFGNPMRVIEEPQDAIADIGQTVDFHVDVEAEFLFTVFQWRRDGLPLVNGGNISGATSDTLQVSNVTLADQAFYDVTVTSACGLITSATAELRIECGADWNLDGNVNTADFIAFLNDYNAVSSGGSPTYRDPDVCAPFGILNTADILCYLGVFATGC